MSAFRGFLVVDDDDALRHRLADALRHRGFHASEASNASAAAQIATRGPWRILLDLRMPGSEGVNAIASLKSCDPRNEIVVLTGYGSIATAVAAVRDGAREYLTKPVNVARILAAFGLDDPPGKGTSTEGTPTLDRVEWEHLQRVLEDCDGNVTEAARVLGVHRRSLQRKLKRLPAAR